MISGPQGQALLPWEEEQEQARLAAPPLLGGAHPLAGRMQWDHDALQDMHLPRLLGGVEGVAAVEGVETGASEVRALGEVGVVPVVPAVGVDAAEGVQAGRKSVEVVEEGGEDGRDGGYGGQGGDTGVGGAREGLGAGIAEGGADMKGAGEGGNQRAGRVQDGVGDEEEREGGSTWGDREKTEDEDEAVSEERGADPGLIAMQREDARQQVLQEEVLRRGQELAALREREWEAQDVLEAEDMRQRAADAGRMGEGVGVLDVADREQRKKRDREARSEAEMYAAWPEAAGVCAPDKHPLDYQVHAYVHMYIRRHVCTCACAHTCTYTCTCTHTQTHVHARAHTRYRWRRYTHLRARTSYAKSRRQTRPASETSAHGWTRRWSDRCLRMRDARRRSSAKCLALTSTMTTK